MRVHKLALALAVLCGTSAVLCGTNAAQAAPRKLGVDEAVQLALQQNPRLRGATLRRGAAHDAAKSVGAHMLPSVHLSEEYQRYKDPFKIAFQPGLDFQVRDVDNNTFVAAVGQPLLGLGHIAEDYLALRDQAAASDEGLKAARAALTEAVQAGYLRYFESRALAEIARWSGKELGEQVSQAQARLKAGVITNADLLRVQVAAANARLQEIAAQSQAEVVRANVLAGIGLDPSEADVELVEPASLIGAGGELPADRDAYDEALRRRPEIARDKLLGKSAEHSKRARWLSLLPEVDGEAAYVRVDGQKFAPPESWFIGIRATWTPWEWGAGFFGARAAGLQAEAAAQDLVSEKNAVATEVLTSLSQSRAAAVAVEVAQTTIASAQEAYRVTDALVKAGSATTTDLLDAQSALTGARLNLARARYELAIQRVTLSRVMGR